MKQRIIQSSALLIIILSICFSAFAIIGKEGAFSWTVVIRNMVYNLPGFTLMGYLDYCILKRMNNQMFKKWIYPMSIFVVSMGVSLIMCTVVWLFCIVFNVPYDIIQSMMPTALCNSIIVLILCIFLNVNNIINKEQRLNELEKEKMIYQMDALEQQLEPHFLFNSLNSLASLAYIDAEKTNMFAKKLSLVYRYLLSMKDETGVIVSNNIQIRPIVCSSHKGPNNIRRQYKFFCTDISISNNGVSFAVQLPFINESQ